METLGRVVGMSYWRWWGKGQNLEAELLVVEEAVLDAESTVSVAAASLKRWELADVGRSWISSTASKMYDQCDHWSPSYQQLQVKIPFSSPGSALFSAIAPHCKMLDGNLLLFLPSHIPPPDLIPIFLARPVSAHEEVDPVLYESCAFCGMISWGFLCEGGRRLSRAEHYPDVHQNFSCISVDCIWLLFSSKDHWNSHLDKAVYCNCSRY